MAMGLLTVAVLSEAYEAQKRGFRTVQARIRNSASAVRRKWRQRRRGGQQIGRTGGTTEDLEDTESFFASEE